MAIEIPDPMFEAEVRRILAKPTGDIMQSDVAGIARLTVSRLGIADLTGIEHFAALEALDCKRNQLTSIDISNNPMLKSLDCSWNEIRTLDVSKNLHLENISCQNNQLTSLDATKNTELSSLCCYNNLFPDASAIAVSEDTNFLSVVISAYEDLM